LPSKGVYCNHSKFETSTTSFKTNSPGKPTVVTYATAAPPPPARTTGGGAGVGVEAAHNGSVSPPSYSCSIYSPFRLLAHFFLFTSADPPGAATPRVQTHLQTDMQMLVGPCCAHTRRVAAAKPRLDPRPAPNLNLTTSHLFSSHPPRSPAARRRAPAATTRWRR